MTAGLPVRPTPAACKINTASPILLHPSLITVFRVVPDWWALGTVLSRPEYQFLQEWKWNQALGIYPGHPSRLWPRSLALNQPIVPVLQPPFYLSSYCAWLKKGFLGSTSLWRHNGRDGFSNHQPQDCLLNRLFRRRSKNTSKLRVTGLCVGNSPVTTQHKGPVTRKMFPFDDVIMSIILSNALESLYNV